MPESSRTFRVGTKRTRVSVPVSPGSKTRKYQRVNVLTPHDFNTERKLYRNPSGKGFHYQHVPQRDPTLRGIIDALKRVRTVDFSIRVLGKLAETPKDYPEDQYPPHEYLYLGQVRITANALAAAKQAYDTYGNDWYQMREWVNNWSNFKWEEIATVYISERY